MSKKRCKDLRGQTPTSAIAETVEPSPVSEQAGQQEDYKVGPGRPPREYQFRRGISGNPKGRPRKDTLGADLRLAFERALRRPAKITDGDRQRITTWARAGIDRLVHQYAQGDRHARRDLFWLAERLGLDLRGSVSSTTEDPLQEGKALLDRYVERQASAPECRSENPVLATPELLDDDPGATE